MDFCTRISWTQVLAEFLEHADSIVVILADAQGRIHLRHRGPGCPTCNQRGYKGRMGIHELLVSDDAIRLHIRQRSSALEILETSLKGGMRTLRQDGIDKVLQGHTDVKEVLAARNN